MCSGCLLCLHTVCSLLHALIGAHAAAFAVQGVSMHVCTDSLGICIKQMSSKAPVSPPSDDRLLCVQHHVMMLTGKSSSLGRSSFLADCWQGKAVKADKSMAD